LVLALSRWLALVPGNRLLVVPSGPARRYPGRGIRPVVALRSAALPSVVLRLAALLSVVVQGTR